MAGTSTVSAIASARRAAVADRYAANSLAVEWRYLRSSNRSPTEWRELAAHALEPNIFYEPAFALPAAKIFGRDAGALLVWSGTSPRKLLGFFPAPHRAAALRAQAAGAGRLDAPLRAARHAAGRARSGGAGHRRMARASRRQSGAARIGAAAVLARGRPVRSRAGCHRRRAQMPVADFNTHQRALLAPDGDRLFYVERTLGRHRHKELRRYVRRLGDVGALLFTTATEPRASLRRLRIS